jgi:hypothetical protein
MQSEKQSISLTKKILQSISEAVLIPFLAILTAVVIGGIIIFVGRSNSRLQGLIKAQWAQPGAKRLFGQFIFLRASSVGIKAVCSISRRRSIGVGAVFSA